jgi:toxin ParE1/3/4
MAGYRLLRRARDDLLDIAGYTAERWDEQQAERYVTDLFSAFDRLLEVPELRRPYREVPPYWRALAGSHAIFYRVEDDGTLLIVRVLHARMLPELHLGNEGDE